MGTVKYTVLSIPHSNIVSEVYIRSPNKPLRWEVRQTGAGSGIFDYICAAVHTEGGQNQIGFSRSVGTNFDTVNANSAGTLYALVGIRLSSTFPGTAVVVQEISILATTSDNFYWALILNPTVAGTFTYSAVSQSGVERAIGDIANNPSTNTVTGGIVLRSGIANQTQAVNIAFEIESTKLGIAINGTADTMVFVAGPMNGSSNLDIGGILSWSEM